MNELLDAWKWSYEMADKSIDSVKYAVSKCEELDIKYEYKDVAKFALQNYLENYDQTALSNAHQEWNKQWEISYDDFRELAKKFIDWA